MVSHTSTAVALALRASTPVQPGKTRICISGFAKYSHNTGHSKKLADAVVKAYPQQHETWYHMASTDLEVCAPLALRMHRAPTKSPRLASSVLAMSANKSRVAAIRLHNLYLYLPAQQRQPTLFAEPPHVAPSPHHPTICTLCIPSAATQVHFGCVEAVFSSTEQMSDKGKATVQHMQAQPVGR